MIVYEDEHRAVVNCYSNVITNVVFQEYWKGVDPTSENDTGNSIIFKMNDGRYMYVGISVCTFRLAIDDEIVEYSCILDKRITDDEQYHRSHGLPFPVIIGKNNAYFLANMFYLPLTTFKNRTLSCLHETALVTYIGEFVDNPRELRDGKALTEKLLSYYVQLPFNLNLDIKYIKSGHYLTTPMKYTVVAPRRHNPYFEQQNNDHCAPTRVSHHAQNLSRGQDLTRRRESQSNRNIRRVPDHPRYM